MKIIEGVCGFLLASLIVGLMLVTMLYWDDVGPALINADAEIVRSNP